MIISETSKAWKQYVVNARETGEALTILSLVRSVIVLFPCEEGRWTVNQPGDRKFQTNVIFSRRIIVKINLSK